MGDSIVSTSLGRWQVKDSTQSSLPKRAIVEVSLVAGELALLGAGDPLRCSCANVFVRVDGPRKMVLYLGDERLWLEAEGYATTSDVEHEIETRRNLAGPTPTPPPPPKPKAPAAGALWGAGVSVPQTAAPPQMRPPTRVDPAPARMMKRCPMCAEDVWAEARICRHCRFEFGEEAPSSVFAAPTGADAAIATRVFETVEIVDHDTGRQRNAFSGDNRHFLLVRHVWPGGAEDWPIAEWFVPYTRAPEDVVDRSRVQMVLEEVAREATSRGWTPEPSTGPWYSRRFRREIPPGTEAGSLARPEAAAAMRAILQGGDVPKGFWET